ncbi:ribonuclease H-like domain-containing protein [Tanacetum coccineum]
MESQSDSTQTVSSLKLPMLKTGDYDLWSMRMEQYLTHTDYALWEVIVNGDAPAVASASTEGPIPPKTAEQKIARKNELKAKSTLLLAIPDEHLLKFHGIKDAKSLWEAIKTRAPRNQGNRNGDNARRVVPVETPANALVVQDGNISDIEVHTCSKNCLKSFEALQKQYDQQKEALNKSIPPPYTGNFKPARADLSFNGLDDSVYKSKVSETIPSMPNVETTITKTSKDSLEKPKTVRSSAPIIEDWESDSEDENVFEPKEVKKTVKSSFKKIEFVKARNSTIEKPRNFSQNPSDNKRNRNRWDFAPTAVLTKSGIVLISAARRSSSRAAAPAINTAKGNKVTSAVGEQGMNAVKSSACWIWRPKQNIIDHISKDSGSYMPKRFDYGNPQYALQDQGIFDSGCSRHMTGNKFYLSDYQDIDGGFVAFGGSSKGGKITRKGKIRTGKLDFEDVYFVKELKFNLFSVSQMCDKKNSVLFTETECLVLSPDFKLLDESQVLLKIPRQNNMYSFDLKNVVPLGDLTCLFAKATIDESNLWHRRLGHINFKTMNKLVRGNLVRGLPLKLFENDHTCVACQKGKQHKASCRKPALSFMSPFGCPVTILNNLDHLGTGPNWMFDIDTLTMSMNYQPVFTGNQTNGNVEDEVADDAGKKNGVEDPVKEDDINGPGEATNTNSTNRLNTSKETKGIAAESSYENLGGSTLVNAATPSNADYHTDPLMPDLEDLLIFKILVYLQCHMNDEGVPLFSVSKPFSPCSKVFTGDFYRDHAVSCAGIIGIKHRHNVVRDTLVDICFRSGILTGKEVDIGLVEVVTKPYVLRICYFIYGMERLMWEFEVDSVTLLKRIRKFFMAQDIVHTVKRIFRYLKGNPQQEVLWIKNQILDYGFNFMNTKIYIDNESTICNVKNPIFHSKTKHIKIRHHFMRDSYEKKLIQVIKIHTDHNVADLLIKAFDVSRKSKKFSRKVTPLFDSMLVQNQAPKGEGSTIPPEPQPTPSTSQPNVSEPQTESLQTETPPTVSHELQTEAHIEQILPSPSTYQRKQRKTQKHRRAKQVTVLPQTSVPLDHGADEAVHKEGVTAPRNHGGALAQTRSERVLEKPNEPPLPEGHTSGSGEGSMEHTFELMDTVPPTPHDSPLIGGLHSPAPRMMR